MGQVQRELAGLAAAATTAELRLPDVRSLMAERLAGRPIGANFRSGSFTVCTMVPMRSVPHRVVCLLGLDDGVFPRATVVDGDDVLARTPLTGERDPRSEDRQLLLDAVLAATEHLVVTYTGADETTGRPRPPAVPLGELLDALDVTAPGGKEHALWRHPLQPFDRRNLVAGDVNPSLPFSFDPAALAGALAAAGERHLPVGFLGGPLAEEKAPDIDLAALDRVHAAPGPAVLPASARRHAARRGHGGAGRPPGRRRQPRPVGGRRATAPRRPARPRSRPGAADGVAPRCPPAGTPRLATGPAGE